MGFTQVEETQLEEEFIWPTSCAWQAFWVSSVAFDLDCSQPLPDVAIVALEYIPETVPEVIEPSLEHRVEFINDAF